MQMQQMVWLMVRAFASISNLSFQSRSTPIGICVVWCISLIKYVGFLVVLAYYLHSPGYIPPVPFLDIRYIQLSFCFCILEFSFEIYFPLNRDLQKCTSLWLFIMTATPVGCNTQGVLIERTDSADNSTALLTFPVQSEKSPGVSFCLPLILAKHRCCSVMLCECLLQSANIL